MKTSPINCSVCGREVGTKPGIQVILGLVCTDPICNYQEPINVNESRDALIVAGVLENVPVVQIARSTGMSRQRVYQIVDTWRGGE